MRYDDYYDDDYEISPEDVRDTYKSIEALTRGYDDRHTYTRSVNRVFFDIFGINEIGSIFGSRSRSRRDDAFRVNVFRKCGTKRLVDMILDDESYLIIQNLVKLHYDITHATTKREKLEEAIAVYQDTINRLKKQYGIRTRTSVQSISNPLKTLRKLNRDYEDDDYYYGRRSYSIYDDDDDYYDDRRRRRSRRRDDWDDDDEEFVNAILKGVEPVEYRRKGSKKNRSESSRSSRRDDDYDADDDFEAITADTFAKVADSLSKINDRLDNLENASDYYEPEPVREPVRTQRQSIPEDDSAGIRTTLDALTRSVRTIALNQAKDRDDLNDVIGIIKDSLVDDEEEEEELPPNIMSGDIIKTQGGIDNSSS